MVIHSTCVIGPLPSASTPSCMRVINGQQLVLAKDVTLLRLLDSDHPRNRGLPASTAAFLGPLVSKKFQFDRVYDQSKWQADTQHTGNQMRQEELYARSLRGLIKHAIEGRNVCVIGYGATNGSKNVTMSGDSSSRGLIGLALDDLFAQTQRRSNSVQLFQLAATLVHLQHDHLKDMMCFDGNPLKVMTNEEGTQIVGAKRIRLRTKEQLDEIVDLFRTSTKAKNVQTILTIFIEHLDLQLASELSAVGEQHRLPQCINLVSKIQFVELASSELALAGAPSLISTASTSVSLPSSYSLDRPSSAITLTASRASRHPTVVKQAQLSIDAQRRELISKGSYESRLAGTPSFTQSPNTFIPTVQYEQKCISKCFDALEHIIFQLSSKARPEDYHHTTSTDPFQPIKQPSAQQQHPLPPSQHISYRGHKLTWILADTLTASPNNDVLCLHFVSPLESEMEQSLATARYGARIAEWWRKRREKDEKQQRSKEIAVKKKSALAVRQEEKEIENELQADAIEAYENELKEEMEPYPTITHSPPKASAISSTPIPIFSQPVTRSRPTSAKKATATPKPLEEEKEQTQPQDSTPSTNKPRTPQSVLRSSKTPSSVSPYPRPPTISKYSELDAYLNSAVGPKSTHVLPLSFIPTNSPTMDIAKEYELKYGDWMRVPVTLQSSPLQHPEEQPSPASANRPSQPLPHSSSKPISPAAAARLNMPPTNPSPAIHSNSRSATYSASRESHFSPPATHGSFDSVANSRPLMHVLPGVTPSTPSAAVGHSFHSLPSRLFDVLDVLKHAKFGLRENSPSSAWPYQKDVILNELSDQLAAWQESHDGSFTELKDQLKDAMNRYGRQIPAQVVENLIRAQERKQAERNIHGAQFNSPTGTVYQPQSTDPITATALDSSDRCPLSASSPFNPPHSNTHSHRTPSHPSTTSRPLHSTSIGFLSPPLASLPFDSSP